MSMARRLTSRIGVGYCVLQCSTVMSSVVSGPEVSMSIARLASSVVAMPVDMITGIPWYAMRSRYGRFVISPDGTFI